VEELAEEEIDGEESILRMSKASSLFVWENMN